MVHRREKIPSPEPFCPHCDCPIGEYRPGPECRVVSLEDNRDVMVYDCPHCGEPFHNVMRDPNLRAH